MDRIEFERVTQEAFDSLPPQFRDGVENVRIVVEEIPPASKKRRIGLHEGSLLLGLYEGIPLTKRGTEYGVYPTLPDTITLYQRNLEAVSRSEAELRNHIRDTLIHELGHYFGMSEAEVRRAGY